MDINNSNIASYINYLHIIRYGTPADPILQSKWQQVPASQLQGKIAQLYQHWNITLEEGKRYEMAFANTHANTSDSSATKIFTPPPPSVPPTTHSSTSATYLDPQASALPPRSRNNTVPILIILLLIVGGAVAFYYFANSQGNNDVPTNDASVVTTDATPTTTVDYDRDVTSIAVPTDTIDTNRVKEQQEDKELARIQTITSLIEAEQSRELSTILASFSDNTLQYWDKQNPTKDDIKNLYYKTWSNTGEQTFSNVKIRPVDANTYELTADYSYYSIKDDVQKDIPVRTRYVFDQQNKIIKTYGVK